MRKVLINLFIVFLLISQVYAYSVPVNVSVLPTYTAEVIDLNMDTDPVIRYQSTSFIVVIENTGNTAINATPRINITNSSGYLIDTLNFDSVKIPAFGVVAFIKSWNAGNNSLGIYNATSVASYENNTTPEVTRSFSIIPKPKNINSGGYIFIPEEGKIIPPHQEELMLEFVKLPVLIETLPGDTVLSSVEIVNPTNETLELSAYVEVKRIDPKLKGELVKIIPGSLSIAPNESEKLNLIASIPMNVSSNDYFVSIKVGNEIFEDENFFILRVNPHHGDYDHPLVKRSVVIDNKNNITSVSLKIENSKKPIKILEVIEQISKEMAISAEQITFETKPEILLDDPLVKWRFEDLAPYETEMIYYEIPGVLKEYSLYVYWPVRQMNIFNYYESTDDEPVEKIRITDISSPSFLPGKPGEVFFRVTNFDKDPVDINVNLELPAYWTAEPSEVTRSIPPRGTIMQSIQVTPHSSTSPGTYLTNIWVSYDDVEMMEGITLLVDSQTSLQRLNLPIMAFVAVFLLLILFLIFFNKKNK